MAITNETRDRIIQAAKRELMDLLDEHAIGIAKAFDEAEKDTDADKVASLSVGLGVKLTRADSITIDTECKIAYATKKGEKRTVPVRTGKDLVDAMEDSGNPIVSKAAAKALKRMVSVVGSGGISGMELVTDHGSVKIDAEGANRIKRNAEKILAQ